MKWEVVRCFPVTESFIKCRVEFELHNHMILSEIDFIIDFIIDL